MVSPKDIAGNTEEEEEGANESKQTAQNVCVCVCVCVCRPTSASKCLQKTVQITASKGHRYQDIHLYIQYRSVSLTLI